MTLVTRAQDQHDGDSEEPGDFIGAVLLVFQAQIPNLKEVKEQASEQAAADEMSSAEAHDFVERAIAIANEKKLRLETEYNEMKQYLINIFLEMYFCKIYGSKCKENEEEIAKCAEGIIEREEGNAADLDGLHYLVDHGTKNKCKDLHGHLFSKVFRFIELGMLEISGLSGTTEEVTAVHMLLGTADMGELEFVEQNSLRCYKTMKRIMAKPYIGALRRFLGDPFKGFLNEGASFNPLMYLPPPAPSQQSSFLAIQQKSDKKQSYQRLKQQFNAMQRLFK